MMSKEWGQELHIDDTSQPSASDWLKICASSNQNHFLDLGSDTDVEFLHSFLGHHFVGKPALVLRKPVFSQARIDLNNILMRALTWTFILTN